MPPRGPRVWPLGSPWGHEDPRVWAMISAATCALLAGLFPQGGHLLLRFEAIAATSAARGGFCYPSVSPLRERLETEAQHGFQEGGQAEGDCACCCRLG